MGCCQSHGHDHDHDRSHSGEKKRDTPPSGCSSLPLEVNDCTRTPYLPLTSSGTTRHSPLLPPAVAGSADCSKSPPFLEEESVKEVIPESANRRSSPLPASLSPPNAAWFPPQPPDLRTPPSLSDVDRVVGDEETSEICSASESLSTSTIPERMREGDEDWGDHKMLDRDRAEQSPMSNNTWTSPSKFQRRSRGGGNNTSSTGTSTSPIGGGDDSAAYSYSPNSSSSSRRLEAVMRRSQDHPRRPLRGVSRPGGRQMGVIPLKNAPAAPRPEDKRSGRIRSRSPAMRSGERHNSSMGRRTQNAVAGEDKTPAPAPEGEADSLDNPLVSLECFIFL